METEESGASKHVVAVALTGGRKSKYILKWALDQFSPEGNVVFKILHVYRRITRIPTPSRLLKTKELGDVGNPGPGSYTSTNNYKLEPSESHRNSTSAQNRIRESKEATHYSFQGTNKSLGNNTSVNHSYNSGDSGSWVSDKTSPGGSFVGTPPTSSSVSIPYGGSFTGTPPTGSSVSIPIGGSFRGTPPTGSSVSIPYGGSFTGTPPTGSPMSIPMAGSFTGTPPAGSYVGNSAAVSFVGGSFTGGPPTGSSVSILMGGSFTGTPPGSYVGTSPVSLVETPPGSFMAAGSSSPASSE